MEARCTRPVGSLRDCASAVNASTSLSLSFNWARRLTKGTRQASSSWYASGLHRYRIYCNFILESIY
jgi:hypothetical protein